MSLRLFYAVVILCFVTWTPWPAALVIAVYAILSNLPCIVLQRQNRLRLAAILRRTRARR